MNNFAIITASSNNKDAYKAFDKNNNTSWQCSGISNVCSNDSYAMDKRSSYIGGGKNKYYKGAHRTFDKNKNTSQQCSGISDGYSNDPYAMDKPCSYIGGGKNKNHNTKVIFNNLNDATSNYDCKGEWLQIKMPFSYYLVKYTISIPIDGNFPIKYTILGSNDGTSWYYVDMVSFNKDYDKLSGKTKITASLNSIFKYSYYRLIINEIKPYTNNGTITNNRTIKITDWGLEGTISHNLPVKRSILTENFNDLHLLSFEKPTSFTVSSDKENKYSVFQMQKGLENTIYDNEFIDNFYILFFLILGIISTPVYFYYRNNKK